MIYTEEKLVELLYHRKLPAIWRKKDRKNKLQFRRYLSSLTEGGFMECLTPSGPVTINGNPVTVEGLLDIVDPEKCPDEFLPSFLQSFGIEWQEDIPALYQRRLLGNIGELNRRRGTYAGVRFLVRALTGMECDLEYFRGTIKRPDGVEEYGRWLLVTCIAKTISEVALKEVSAWVIARYLKYYVPYYITIRARSVIAVQHLEISPIYRVNFMTANLSYDLLG